MRRTSPRNGSLIFQGTVGIFAFVVAVLTLWRSVNALVASRRVTNPYHRAGDPTRSVHFVIGRRLDFFMGRFDPELSSNYRDPPFSHYVAEGSGPEDRRYYAVHVFAGWCALAFASLAVAFVCGFAVNLVFGLRRGQIVAFAILALGFFCLAGATNAMRACGR